MKIADRTVLLCDCGGTMPLDGAAIASAVVEAGLADEVTPPIIHRILCRDEIGAVRRAATDGKCLIACTQEVQAFRKAASEAGASDALDFVNIREAAAWSVEAERATPKIVAMLAAAAIDSGSGDFVNLTSAGRTLVYGRDQAALDAAERLAERLDVVLILAPDSDMWPPSIRSVPISVGTLRSASGSIGSFLVTFDGYADLAPWARDISEIAPSPGAMTLAFDLILDLSNERPWFPDGRLGYARADLRRPALVEQALFELSGLVGVIAKPRYVAHDSSLCAHVSGGKIGCTRCLDVCPTGAVTSDSNAIKIDAAICAGCGSCASLCPTEAITYGAPSHLITRRRIAALTNAFHAAGGDHAVILAHTAQRGEAMLAALARSGPGLPANVLPLALRHTTQLGLDAFATAFALGAVKFIIQVDEDQLPEAHALEQQVALANRLFAALGLVGARVALLASADPEDILAEAKDIANLPDLPTLAEIDVAARKNDLVRTVFEHFAAATRVDEIPLAARAPFGRIVVGDSCTVCLACARACPTSAISGQSNPSILRFEEQSCVQCGLCSAVCPERAISLEPRLSLSDAVARPEILRSDEPAVCPCCGARFGARLTLERVVAKLESAGWAQDNPALAKRLRMCDTCRVTDQ